ncbi:LytTR family transcriptional regulator DNA-binding domain-containing protein [Aquimarina agarilytica]|uniref:LytTR family transcriptional regulator DNA-binding domain-containing protein n=1 Tax=Aquimarina agarilytica TaxID=1087449 RepID=UPI000287FB32|nr:LytTR family DNA-binding domain-containing protein [Aquimarina agarilytica]
MRKDKLYFLTFISIAVIFLIIASLGINYFIKISVNQLIEVQLEASKREADEIASLVNYEFINGLDKNTITQNLQNTLNDSNKGTSFVSVFDWSGKTVCHPDITQVNQKVNSNQNLLESLKDGSSLNKLYDLLIDHKKSKETNVTQVESEIVYISPVKSSDLIIAAHTNLDKMVTQIVKLKRRYYTIFILMGILIILASFFAVRFIGSYYEKQLELKNTNLESELINLSKLNMDLVAYQQKIAANETEEAQKPTAVEANTNNETNKIRLLTYIRNELVPVAINSIAYIYTENTITYIVCTNGSRSTSNSSLDEIFVDLQASLFFRANRQFIISITSIKKIIKYGNSQLKILVEDADVEIIISKHKAAEFRKWLNI